MSFHRTRNRRCKDDLNTSLVWWKYDKRNTFTQNTSLKEHTTLSSCHDAVRHTISSAVFLKQNLLLVSVPTCQYMSELEQPGCLWWADMPTIFVIIQFSCSNYV